MFVLPLPVLRYKSSSNNLQLHSSVTPEVIAEAAAAGITGVKMYPQGNMSTINAFPLEVEY
jgi:dihydroorotase